MARLNKSLFPVSGALGPVVIKKLGDTLYAATRPESFMPGTDAASVERRAKFAINAHISKYLARNSIVHNVWKSFNDLKKPVFRQLLSENYHKFSVTAPPVELSIVPANGFELTLNEFSLTGSELRIVTAPLGTVAEINPVKEIWAAVVAMIYLYDPEEGHDEKSDFEVLVPIIQPLSLDSELVFSFKLFLDDKHIYNPFRQYKAFCAFVTLDSSEKAVHYSKNIS